MLSPDVRSLYTSALKPPPGMVFDEAIAATFSMDPALLLQAPVHLALMVGDEAAGELDALQALEAIRRHSERITAYVQRGRITVPSQATTLFSLLESMTVEVASPGGGAFHPKLWLIRFMARGRDDQLLRLVVLSRNLTADRSWDLSLQMDGTITRRRRRENQALSELIRRLPEWATGSVDESRVVQATRLADDVRKVEWDVPAGFDEDVPYFYAPGLDGCGWKPERSRKLAVISPFCSNRALKRLAESSDQPVVLISTPEAIDELETSVVESFGDGMCLDQAVESDDGEETPDGEGADTLGLHAKAYLYERKYYKDYTHLVMGSANATDAALVANKNVELLVELVGRTDKVGGVDQLLSSDGLGEYLIPFMPREGQKPDAEKQAAEKALESARDSLAKARLRVSCSQETEDGENRLMLQGEIPRLDGIRTCRAWPITLGAEQGVLLRPGDKRAVLSNRIASASVTSLIAFELLTAHPDVKCRFVLSLPIEGVPEDRDAAVLRTIINNEEGFLRYLLLLLGEESGGMESSPGLNGTFARWLAVLRAGDDVPLLEELTRTFCRNPERLNEVKRLVDELTVGRAGEAVVPRDFMSLWRVFEKAMEVRNG